MTDQPQLDTGHAHKFFSAHCFNSAWELIDKPERTPEETEQMIQRTLASLWHWTQRPDCSPTNLSIGYWQAARVYALAGEAANARKYARLCLDITPTDAAFYLGYAHEAMARAEALAGNEENATEHLAKATQFATNVTKAEDRKLLEADLASLA
jgi:Flp pilus assembly protein TadD